MEFHTPGMEDLDWIKACVAADPQPGCDYSFVNLFGWSRPCGQEVKEWNGFLISRFSKILGGCYLWPVGGGDEAAALEYLKEDAHRQGWPLRLVVVPEHKVAGLEERYPGQFKIYPDRDSFDYCYDIDKMCELSGKKLHGKRNHIHRFMEAYGDDWSVEPITEANVRACFEMEGEWLRSRADTDSVDILAERRALDVAVNHFSLLKMDGVLLRAGGEVVAFSMGDLLTEDTYDVHFEKARGDIQGTYPLIAREFARLIRDKYPNVRWLNRENDMGLEGLRRAKESFYPDKMIEKYTLFEK
jgi:hypothetical protein